LLLLLSSLFIILLLYFTVHSQTYLLFLSSTLLSLSNSSLLHFSLLLRFSLLFTFILRFDSTLLPLLQFLPLSASASLLSMFLWFLFTLIYLLCLTLFCQYSSSNVTGHSISLLLSTLSSPFLSNLSLVSVNRLLLIMSSFPSPGDQPYSRFMEFVHIPRLRPFLSYYVLLLTLLSFSYSSFSTSLTIIVTLTFLSIQSILFPSYCSLRHPFTLPVNLILPVFHYLRTRYTYLSIISLLSATPPGP